MASALQRGSFELCGAEADGAISWVYLRDVAIPAMREGAEQAGRPVPPLIAHAPICVHDDPEEVRVAARQQLASPLQPLYQRMFAAAGFPEASEGTWSDSMIDAVVFSGDEARVTERIQEMFSFGASEMLVSPIGAGGDQAESIHRTTRLLAELGKVPGVGGNYLERLKSSSQVRRNGPLSYPEVESEGTWRSPWFRIVERYFPVESGVVGQVDFILVTLRAYADRPKTSRRLLDYLRSTSFNQAARWCWRALL